MAAKSTPLKISLSVPAIVAALVLLGLGAWWYVGQRGRQNPPQTPKLSAEARDYLDFLKLSDVQMKKTESYMKVAVVEIEGKISNHGNRAVKLVEVNCVFRDPYGQLILREPAIIAGRRTGILNPGETKNFRLAFDNIPESWNQSMPDLVIAQIQFS